MNVLDQSAVFRCTSCGVCATVCSKNAISIQLNDDGFYRPFIDTELCNDCGLCTTVCYKFSNDIRMSAPCDLIDKPLYSAWSNDDDLVKNTTSGGIGDLLAHELQKEGYKVVGVVYNEKEIRAEHRIADSEDDLTLFRGSKYIQSYTFDAFKEVVENCRKEKYAVFGTPCQIFALCKMAEKRKVRDNFFFVDFYCHGCPSINAWEKYQYHLKEITGVDHFDSVSFRSKAMGWGAYYIIEAKSNGKPIFISKKTGNEFYELFFSDQILNESCSDCQIRSTLEYTDIRMGDFWGHKFLDNRRGVSAVSLVTEQGKLLFERIKNNVICTLCSYDDLLPNQSWNKKYAVNALARKAVLSSLSSPDANIEDAIKVLRKQQGIKTAVKRVLKEILALFPQGLTIFLKKVLYKIRNR